MSRITDYILEPKVVYTEGGFLVRVKVQDDYKYKKYIVSENLHYKTVEGTSFTLTDADSTKQASITELKGNTTQEGTPTPSSPVEVSTVSGDNNVVVSNKNMADYSKFVLGYVNGTNGTVVNSHTQKEMCSDFIPVTPNTSYTFSIQETTDTEPWWIGIGEYNKDKTFTVRKVQQNQSYQTFTTNATTYFIRASARNLENATKVQLEKGRDVTSYLAFQGGSYRIDLGGKNKFNLLTTMKSTWRAEVVSLSSESITIKPTQNGVATVEWQINNIKPNCAYTVRVNMQVTGASNNYNGRILFRCYDSSNTQLSTNGFYGNNTSATITTPANTSYMCLLLYASNGADDNWENLRSTYTNVMICEGADTTYSPYTSNPIELCKIGSYQDKLYYDSGKWYIEKQVGKVVLKGESSEGWTKVNNCFQTSGEYPSDIKAIGSTLNALSSHFKYEYWASGITSNMTNNCFGWNTAKKLTMRYDTCSTANDFTTWLSSNNVTVYYQLSTPTYTEITDTYLLNQLNGLLDMELYENLCYVDWVGIEKPTMTLQYSGTEDLGIKYIITEDNKKIRTDWRKLGRRKKWKMK